MPSVRQLHIQDADLGLRRLAHLAAERLAQELMAEAEAQERHAPHGDGVADRRHLRLQPGMLVRLPDVHRPAHDPERVIAIEGRDLVAGIQLDSVPGDAVGGEEVPEDAGMLDIDMLEDEKSHEEDAPWG